MQKGEQNGQKNTNNTILRMNPPLILKIEVTLKKILILAGLRCFKIITLKCSRFRTLISLEKEGPRCKIESF